MPKYYWMDGISITNSSSHAAFISSIANLLDLLRLTSFDAANVVLQRRSCYTHHSRPSYIASFVQTVADLILFALSKKWSQISLHRDTRALD